MIMRRSAHEVSVRMVRKLYASPRDVYASWTTSKLLGQWLTEDTDTVKALAMNVRKGGKFRLEGIDCEDNAFSFTGTYLDVIEDRHLSFSWEYDGPNPNLRCGPSVVMIDIRPLALGCTELSVAHHLLEQDNGPTAVRALPRAEKQDRHIDSRV